MSYLLNWRVWAALALAVGLAITHAFIYRVGKAKVRAAWDAEKITQLQNAKDAEHENRNIESARSRNVIEAQSAATARAQRLQTDAGKSRTESDGLRNDLATLRLQLPSLTRDAVNKYADTASVVFDNCQRAYQELAGKADGHASDTLTLQQAWPKK